MGEAHCICKKRPCECNNGWGHFETEAGLLEAITAEIRAGERRVHGGYDGDYETVVWMVGEGYVDPELVARELGMSLRKVRRIFRDLDL